MSNSDIQSLAARAKQAEQDGDWLTAETCYRECLQLEVSSYYASRFINAMRRQSAQKAAAAVRAGERATERWPTDTYIKNALVWAYYAAHVKGVDSTDSGSTQAAVRACRRTFELTAEQQTCWIVVRPTLKALKARREWTTLWELAEPLNPAELDDDQGTSNDGKRIPSDRQQCCWKRITGLIETGAYDDALGAVDTYLVWYANDHLLHWWRGRALAGLGRDQDALDAFKKANAISSQWWIQRSIAAEYEALGDPGQALVFYAQAALASNRDPEFRIGIFEKLAELLEGAGRIDDAALHWALVGTLAHDHDWEKRESRTQESVEGFIARQPDTTLPTGSEDDLLRSAKTVWRSIVADLVARGCGVVKSIPPGKDFGFLRADDAKPGSRDIYFKLKDSTPAARVEGTRVTFILGENLDKKSGEIRSKATDVRPA